MFMTTPERRALSRLSSTRKSIVPNTAISRKRRLRSKRSWRRSTTKSACIPRLATVRRWSSSSRCRFPRTVHEGRWHDDRASSLENENAPTKNRTGVLWVERDGDRRSDAVLTRNFSMKTGHRKKNKETEASNAADISPRVDRFARARSGGMSRTHRAGSRKSSPCHRTSRELLVGEAGQSSQVTPVGAGQVAAVSVSQLFAYGRRQGRFQRCGADANPSLEMALAGPEHHAGLMTISSHEFKDTRWGVLEVEENIAGITILGIGKQIYVVTLAVACAQKAHHPSTPQLTRIPKPFSRTHSTCGMVNQTDEVEFIRHSRQLAADSVQGKKKSALGHGFENAIEAPRRYNDFQRTATTPLTLCLSPRVHSTKCACHLSQFPEWRTVRV